MFRPTELAEARKLLQRLLHKPEDYMSHLRLYVQCTHACCHMTGADMLGRMTGSTIISIAYGLKPLEKEDPYISHAEEAMAITNAAYPGTFMVDHLPFCKCSYSTHTVLLPTI